MRNQQQYPQQNAPNNAYPQRQQNSDPQLYGSTNRPSPFTSMPDLFNSNPNPYYSPQIQNPTSLPEFSYGNHMTRSHPQSMNPYHNAPYNQGPNPFGNLPGVQTGNYNQIPVNQPAFGNPPLCEGQSNSTNNFVKNLMLKNILKKYSDSIFVKHDANRSGFLDVREIYPAICEVFQMSNLPRPAYPEVIEIMKSFDTNGDGLIDVDEFRNLIFMMNGM
jgi:hypothetical protein